MPEIAFCSPTKPPAGAVLLNCAFLSVSKQQCEGVSGGGMLPELLIGLKEDVVIAKLKGIFDEGEVVSSGGRPSAAGAGPAGGHAPAG